MAFDYRVTRAELDERYRDVLGGVLHQYGDGSVAAYDEWIEAFCRAANGDAYSEALGFRRDELPGLRYTLVISYNSNDWVRGVFGRFMEARARVSKDEYPALFEAQLLRDLHAYHRAVEELTRHFDDYPRHLWQSDWHQQHRRENDLSRIRRALCAAYVPFDEAYARVGVDDERVRRVEAFHGPAASLVRDMLIGFDWGRVRGIWQGQPQYSWQYRGDGSLDWDHVLAQIDDFRSMVAQYRGLPPPVVPAPLSAMVLGASVLATP